MQQEEDEEAPGSHMLGSNLSQEWGTPLTKKKCVKKYGSSGYVVDGDLKTHFGIQSML